MGQLSLNREYRIPLLSYILLILTVFILKFIFDPGTVFSISAALMLLIPFLVKNEYNYFEFNIRGFIKGVFISLCIIAVYFAVRLAYGLISGIEPGIRDVGISFFIIQLVLVAVPEELFFRGYLQRELGNNYRAVIVTSILFAIAHLLIVCATTGGLNVCVQNGLTFFPSLVMGYLYLKTETLWSSIFFHFIANVVHILLIFT